MNEYYVLGSILILNKPLFDYWFDYTANEEVQQRETVKACTTLLIHKYLYKA